MFMFRKKKETVATEEKTGAPEWLEELRGDRRKRLALDYLAGTPAKELYEQYGRSVAFEVIRFIESKQLTTKEFNEKYVCTTCR